MGGMDDLQKLRDKLDIDQPPLGQLEVPIALGRAFLFHQAAHVEHVAHGLLGIARAAKGGLDSRGRDHGKFWTAGPDHPGTGQG